MILVVTGSRFVNRNADVRAFLDKVRPDVVLVGDCASGVDRATLDWCKANNTRCYQAIAVGPWPAAGPKRNQALVELAEMFAVPGLTVRYAAFPVEGSRGTFDCVNRLRAAGFEGDVL